MQRSHDKAGKSLGRRILIGSFAVGVIGVGPLLLYTLFGPADGNPIGLGLLAVLAAPISVGGMALGAIVMAVRYGIQHRGPRHRAFGAIAAQDTRGR